MVFRVPRDGVNLLGWISVKWRHISFFFTFSRGWFSHFKIVK